MTNTSFKTTMVYGQQASLMQSTRPAGYHSRPHTHECEQINLCLEGEIYVYIKDRAYKLEKGDFFRIPANEPHWAWNRSDKPCVQIQVHAPSFQAFSKYAVELLDEGEKLEATKFPNNIFIDPETLDIERIESLKAIGEE